MKNQTKIVVNISFQTILAALAVVVGCYLFIALRDVLIGLFISILFATALNPIVSWLEKFRLPRLVAALSVYALIIVGLVVMLAAIIPPLVNETNNLIQTLPEEFVADKLAMFDINLSNLPMLTTQFGTFLPAVRLVTSTFSAVVAVFTFIVISFYLLMERKHLHKHLARLFKDSDGDVHAERLVLKIEKQIGGWVRGQLTLMVVIGLLTYIGLRLLNIPYALPLSIFAGLLELIPNIGPTVSAIPAVLVPLAVGYSPFIALSVVALYVLIQNIESNFIVPKIMQDAVGIHPLVTILLIVIGLKLSGVTGAILAVPLFLVAKVCYTELIGPLLLSKK